MGSDLPGPRCSKDETHINRENVADLSTGSLGVCLLRAATQLVFLNYSVLISRYYFITLY